MAKTYGIYVNTRTGHYLGREGLVVWRSEARSFPSIELANDEIVRRGWTVEFGVRPGLTTAYACEVG